MKNSEVVVALVGNNDPIEGYPCEFSVVSNPDHVIIELISTGRTVCPVYAEYKENFYVVLIPAHHFTDLFEIIMVVNELFPTYVNDVGEDVLKRCIVSDDFVSQLRRVL